MKEHSSPLDSNDEQFDASESVDFDESPLDDEDLDSVAGGINNWKDSNWWSEPDWDS